jgi:PhnB protein
MKSIYPYLYFNGNAEEAFNFYRSVFGGEFTSMMRYREMPDSDRVAESEKDKIMHTALPVGNSSLMASDFPESVGQASYGNGIRLMISPESEEEARRLFDQLSSDGIVEMPLDKMFWGDLNGSLTDKFGVRWMIDYSFEQR